MKKLRAAVIGVGYLGRFHAEKYASLPGVDLVGVADSDPSRAAEIAGMLGTTAYDDYRELVGKVDLVSIVVPTMFHHAVASFFLQNGIHVLLEKPITTTVDEGKELIATAAAGGLVFQVGHLERFNPAFTAVAGRLKRPGFIEAVRVAPFKPRGTDVSVVLDLMVHDIDIIRRFVGSEITAISATGAVVYSNEPDIANARIEFACGCVANVTASRISLKSERRMQIFQEDAYISVDFQNRQATIATRGEGESAPGVPAVNVQELSVPQRDQILAEIVAFVDSVANGTPVVVPGEDGLNALETALMVEEKIKESIARFKSAGCCCP
ncbi:MAG TPA: Gfo/Idh/MocA family oxidoreductase [Geobacteraceae bacterium]|nr:Gfo/Idh/MocA family oxidoreductase [Geobacteraceae bacterium]